MNLGLITAAERRRRDEANRVARVRTRIARCRGKCRCGGKLDLRKKKRVRYSTCPDCRLKAKQAYDYKKKHGCTLTVYTNRRKPKLRLDKSLQESTGVRRYYRRDGLGRMAWWWHATIYFDGKLRHRRFSVDKYGDAGAHKLAKAQRRAWEKERDYKVGNK